MEEFKLSQEEVENFNKIYSGKYIYAINEQINKFRPGLENIRNLLLAHTHSVEYEEKPYTLGDMIKIVYDFYKSLDINLYEKLFSILHDDSVSVNFSEPAKHDKSRHNVCSQGDRGRKISLAPENNLYGLITVCHEFCHMLSQRMQENKRAVDSTIGEVETLFIEKVFANYLLENGIITNAEYENTMMGGDYSLLGDITYCFQRNDLLNIIDCEQLTGEKVDELVDKLKNNPNCDVLLSRLKKMASLSKTSPADYSPIERYVIGQIVGTVLFDRYQNDRQCTIEKFKNYLSHNSELTFSQMLKELLDKDAFGIYNEYMDIKEREFTADREQEN